MKTSKDLSKLATDISKNFIEGGKPLTNLLMKTAEGEGLTPQEIERVAELTNVETYLGLINKSQDKYLQFELADAKFVRDKVASWTEKESYDISYDDLLASDENINFFPETAEQADISNIGALRKIASRKNGVLVYIGNLFLDKKAEFEINSSNTLEMLKQALLSGYSPEDLKGLVKTATPILADHLNNFFFDKLQNENPTIDFSKKASSDLKINEEGKLFQNLVSIGNQFEHLKKIAALHTNLYSDLEEFSKEHNSDVFLKIAKVTTKAMKGFFKFFKEKPVLATGATAGVASIPLLGYGLYNDKNKHLKNNLFTKETISDNLLKRKEIV